ncbi:MAG TPA: hypothetical protein VF867_18790 [Arthrobacter sp.]
MFSHSRKKSGRRAAEPAPQTPAQAAAAARVQNDLQDARRRLAAAEKKHRKAKEDTAALRLPDVATRREEVERLQVQAGLIEAGNAEAIAGRFDHGAAPASAARH